MRMDFGFAMLALIVTAVGGCGGDATADTPRPIADQYIVAIDISGSRTEKQLREAQGLVERLIENEITSGDRLVLLEMFGHRAGLPDRWDDSIMSPKDPARLSARDKRILDDFRADALGYAPEFFSKARAKTIIATDIFSTLQEAADLARASRSRRTTLVLLSDMIHAAGEVNMARSANIPDDRWIAERKQQSRLPDLTGICVIVAGADVSSTHGARLREFWSSYIAAAGGNLGDYRSLITSANELSCG